MSFMKFITLTRISGRFFAHSHSQLLFRRSCAHTTVEPILVESKNSRFLSRVAKFNSFFKDTISNYSDVDRLPWEVIEKKLTNYPELDKEKNLSSVILNACLSNGLYDIGISYYERMINLGDKPNIGQYTVFLRLLARSKNMTDHKDLIEEIFFLLKPHIQDQEMIQSESAKVFSKLPHLWKEILNIWEESKLLEGMNFLAAGAFDCDEVEKGWEILEKNPNVVDEGVIQSYLNYCVRMVEKQKFTPKLIDDLVNFCSDKMVTLLIMDIFPTLTKLVSELNRNEGELYFWSVKKSFVKNKTCTNCGYSIKDAEVSDEEIELLRNHLLKDVIIQDNIHLSTTNEELLKFLTFLSSSPKYDLIVDGLNLFHRFKEWGLLVLKRYIKRNNKKVLLIGKPYLKKKKEFDDIEQHMDIFLADSMTDDDLFVLYAALWCGVGTYVLSFDLFRGYPSFFKNAEIRKKFLKWKSTHQCHISLNNEDLVFLRGDLVYPQKTDTFKQKNNLEELCWHLSGNKTSNKSEVYVFNGKHFICLRAVPF